MRSSVQRGRHGQHGQQGHLMAGLVVLIAIMLIFSTVTFQAWEDLLRRDNEAEMMFRAMEISRSIRRYQRDHGGASVTELKQLLEPGPRGQYYARRDYTDPLVADGVWGLLFIGPGGTIIDPAAPSAIPGLEGPAFQKFESGLQSVQNTPAQAGMQIAGVKTLSTDDPFRHYQGFEEYSRWLFTYLDVETPISAVGGQQPPGAGGPGVKPGNVFGRGITPPGAGGGRGGRR